VRSSQVTKIHPKRQTDLQSQQFLLFDLKPIAFATDTASRMPASNALWRSHTSASWLQHKNNSSKGSDLSAFSNQVLIATTMAVEKVGNTLDLSKERLLSRLQHENSTNAELPSFSTTMGSDHARSTNSVIDNILKQAIMSDYNEGSGDGGENCALHIMSILRHVSLRAVYAFSGWEADDRQVQEARTYLRRWINSDVQSVRKCLWHAALIFRTLRKKRRMSCFDVFYILIATLIIWTYCMLHSDTGMSGVQRQQPNHRSADAVRIDKVELSALSSWLQGECHTIHLTGLGVLEGSQGARRVLEELGKVLMSGTEWAESRRGIAWATEQVISGRKAHLRDP
jgi:hypothetical protein